MKRCLADVNVLIALLARNHEHHKLARKWFDGLAAGEAGLCRMVQLALIRLLGNSLVMGQYAMAADAAWRLTGELLEDERLDFMAEPRELESVFPTMLGYPVPTNKLVGDAYVAAFSIAARCRLATFDRGFRQFKGVELDLLHR